MKIKLKFENLFDLATLEINAIWRIQCFFWYCLNTTVRKSNNFNIGTVNVIQREFVKYAFINAIAASLFLFQLSFVWNPDFYFNMRKSYKHRYHSPPHASVITENILICLKYENIGNKICKLLSSLLASNSTFISDTQSLGTIQSWRNLTEHHYYLTSTKSVIFQIDANCSPLQSLNMLPFHIRVESLKLI